MSTMYCQCLVEMTCGCCNLTTAKKLNTWYKSAITLSRVSTLNSPSSRPKKWAAPPYSLSFLTFKAYLPSVRATIVTATIQQHVITTALALFFSTQVSDWWEEDEENRGTNRLRVIKIVWSGALQWRNCRHLEIVKRNLRVDTFRPNVENLWFENETRTKKRIIWTDSTEPEVSVSSRKSSEERMRKCSVCWTV